MPDTTVRGRFVWHELMTTDPRAAAGFFTKVAGWKTQQWPQDPSYTMFVAGKQPMGGVLSLPEDAKAMGAPPTWLTYIGTPNVDETARRIESLGGKILKAPGDIPTIGRFAIVQDPQGAVFAPFTPSGAGRDDAAPEIGDFSWHELATTDLRSALSFYKQLFGWDEAGSMDMGPGTGIYQMFGRNGRTLGGIFNKPKEQPGPPAWLPYIRVPESKDAVAKVKKLGGTILNGPMQVPGGDWIAQGLDLQGAMFAVHSVKPAAVKKAAASRSAKRTAAVKNKKQIGKPARTAARAAKSSTMKPAASPSSRKTARARRAVRKIASRAAKKRR
jgi:predicted enzyme related to lactoylglutathione lyase